MYIECEQHLRTKNGNLSCGSSHIIFWIKNNYHAYILILMIPIPNSKQNDAICISHSLSNLNDLIIDI